MSFERILRAAQFAAKCHDGQTRKYNGRPYIEHPMRVAGRVSMRVDATPELVEAAWLHDTIEDCGVIADDIDDVCGPVVAALVVELTNPSKGMKAPREVRKRLDRNHICAASREAKIIKLLDRIDNLTEMAGCDPSFQRLYCMESGLLLDAIGDADADLAAELSDLIGELSVAVTD